MAHLRRAEHGIDGHENATRSACGKEGQDGLKALFQIDRHAVIALQPEVQETAR